MIWRTIRGVWAFFSFLFTFAEFFYKTPVNLVWLIASLFAVAWFFEIMLGENDEKV